MIIYLAGPLFSLAEKEFNQRLSDLITARMEGASLILPQEECKGLMSGSDAFSDIFDTCVRSIDRADVVLAILDGPDVDSGTGFEVGYAYSKGKPVIGVRTDPRQLEDQGVNCMISRSVNSMIRLGSGKLDTALLADAIVKVLRSMDLAVR